MPEDQLEVVRQAVAAINRGDWDAAFKRMAPDFEYDLTRTISPLQGVYSRGQMRKVAEDFLGPWEAARYEPEEFIDAGEHVVVPFTTHFRGREGIEVQSRATWVWTFRGDLVTRVCLYQERAEALAAAGVATR